MKRLIIPILMLSLVTACKKTPEKPVPNVIDSMAQAKEKNIETTEQKKKTDEVAVKKANDEILQALKSKDYKTFASFIHPEKGISFSMYALVDPKEDRHFSTADFENSSLQRLYLHGVLRTVPEIRIKQQSMIILENGSSQKILQHHNIH